MKKRLIALFGGALVGVALLSPAGLQHIAKSEGEVLTAYPDPGSGGKPWTICFGHTGPEVKPGLRVTHEQCLKWLHEDADKHAKEMRSVVRVPLKQGEYDAYTSFVFNTGATNFSKSTMLRMLNSGNRAGACKQLLRWVYASGRELPGLKTRRAVEYNMCLQGGPYVSYPEPGS